MYSSQKMILINTKTISHVYRCSAETILVGGPRRPAKKDWHASGADYDLSNICRYVSHTYLW